MERGSTENRPIHKTPILSMRSDAHQIADAEREEEARHNDDCKVGMKRIYRAHAVFRKLRNPAATMAVGSFPLPADLLKHQRSAIPTQRATPEPVAHDRMMMSFVEGDLRDGEQGGSEGSFYCAVNGLAFSHRLVRIIIPDDFPLLACIN